MDTNLNLNLFLNLEYFLLFFFFFLFLLLQNWWCNLNIIKINIRHKIKLIPNKKILTNRKFHSSKKNYLINIKLQKYNINLYINF